MRLKTLLLPLLILCGLNSTANVYTVTNNAGNGWWPACGDPGSFLEAICNATANPGRDTIRFNLAGGTVISAAKNPLAIAVGDSDLLIDGRSTIDGNPIVFNFKVDINGNNIDFEKVNFQVANQAHAVAIIGSNNSIDSCDFAIPASGQIGVWINGGSGNSVTNSTFNAAPRHAVSIETTGGHTVSNNTVTNSTDVGIIARGTGSNIIKNNSVSGGAHNGIGVLCPNNTIDSNTVFNNARSGIVCDNTSLTASGNTISYNKVYNNNSNLWMLAGTPDPSQGAIQSNGSSTVVRGNWVYNNASNGIILYSANSTNGIIRGNIVGRDDSGNELGNGWNGIFVWEGNGSTVDSNITVNNGKGASHATYSMPDRISGIRMQEVTSGTVNFNYCGTDPAKTSAGNDFDGITLHTNVSNVVVTNNIVCHNGLNSTYGAGGGIALRNAANNNTIRGNYIGMHQDQTDGGNNDYGISIEGCSGNMIGGTNASDGNFIGFSKNTGNQGCGVWIVLAGATGNELYNNTISSNSGDGVLIERGAVNNKVGSLTAGNTFTQNENGIRVWENKSAGTTGVTNYNTLRGNSFSCNTVKGISLSEDGNNEYGGVASNKIVTSNLNEIRANFVSGTAPANAAVDIYVADQNCAINCDQDAYQGATYVTTVTASGSGDWEYDFSGQPTLNKSNVIVMATDTVNSNQSNSSEFSICVQTCVVPQNIAINGTDEFCAGGQTTLTANSTGKINGHTYKYYWYEGSINAANEISVGTNDSDIVVSTAGTYFVIISDTVDSASCSGQSSGLPIVVNPLPTLNPTAAAGTCQGDSGLVQSGGAGGTGNLNYAWTPGGQTTSDFYATATGTHNVTVTDGKGCTASGSVTITVTDTPTINLTPISPEYCQGDSVVLYSGYTGSGTIQWTPGNGSADTTFANSQGTYTLLVTENGCSSTASVNVTENANPNASLDSVFFCQGDSAVMTAQPSGMNYSWSPGGETTEQITVTSEGSYTVLVTDPTTNCSASATNVAEENDNPNPTVTLGPDTSLCYFKNHTVELVMTYQGSQGGDILWSNGVTDTIAVYSDTVVVWAQYTDNLGCVGADSLKIANFCAPPDVTIPNVFNPWGTDNPVFTPFGNIEPEDVLQGSFVVYNRWGRVMFKDDQEKLPKWDGKINGREASPGVYFWIWTYQDVTLTNHNRNGFVQVIGK